MNWAETYESLKQKKYIHARIGDKEYMMKPLDEGVLIYKRKDEFYYLHHFSETPKDNIRMDDEPPLERKLKNE